GHSALASFTDTLVLNGSSFSYTFPAYSMTVLDLPQKITASALQLGVPPGSTAGAAFNFTVTSRDSSNNVATGYHGTVHFTSTDGQAIPPSDYTFQDADNGIHTFTAIMRTAGMQTIMVQDTADGSLTSRAAVDIAPAAADHFLVAPAITTIVAGSPF